MNRVWYGTMFNLNNTYNKITTSSNTSGSIFGTVTVAVVGGFLFLWQKKKKKNIAVRSKTASIDLLGFESKLYNLDTPPVSTLTWFKGDFSAVKPKLEKRLMLVVEKNPWLKGRITIANCFKRTYTLSYTSERSDSSSVNIDENLEFVPPEDSPLSRDTSFGDLGVAIRDAGLTIKNGTDQPLFKVHIIPCSKSPSERFALLLQMTHVAGDGATYYKLLHMICSIGEDCIQRLEPVRIMRTDEMQEAAMGKESRGLLVSTGLLLRVVRGAIAEKLRGRKTYPRFRFLDPAKMQVLKDASMDERGVASDVQFVSTNDVITSWFMSRTGCGTGFMAINWRNRLEGHTDLHAGNYMDNIFYQKDDYTSPALIRKSMMEYKRAVTKDVPVPGVWKMVTSTRCVALVTNWVSLSKSNEIEGCEEEIHLPLYFNPSFVSQIHALTIFRAGAGRVGLCYLGNTPDGTNPLDDAPFIIKDAA